MTAPTIEFKLSDAALRLLARLEDRAGLLAAMAREIDLQNDLTVSHIVATRLTGKGPFPVGDHKLGERTHLLRRSVRASRAVVSGDSVTSAIGTNVKYAGVHEFGFSGTVMVGGHVRQRFSSRSFIGALKADGKARTVRRKVRGADLAVGSHKRQMNIPARAPFFHGIQDRTEAIGTAVSRAAIKFMEGTP